MHRSLWLMSGKGQANMMDVQDGQIKTWGGLGLVGAKFKNRFIENV